MIHQAPSPFEARRVRDQRVRDMPLVVDKVRGTNLGDWLCGLIVMCVFGALVFV